MPKHSKHLTPLKAENTKPTPTHDPTPRGPLTPNGKPIFHHLQTTTPDPAPTTLSLEQVQHLVDTWMKQRKQP